MQEISSPIDQNAASLSPLHKGRSEEPTTNIADFCNKIDPWRTLLRTNVARDLAIHGDVPRLNFDLMGRADGAYTVHLE